MKKVFYGIMILSGVLLTVGIWAAPNGLYERVLVTYTGVSISYVFLNKFLGVKD